MKKEEHKDLESQEPKLYELGYHIIPTVAEEALGEEVARVREVIESQGGVIVSDQMPQVRDLAYPISKVFANKRKQFDSAYFGWMTFTATPEEIISLNTAVGSVENVLRFIIINAVEVEASADVSAQKMAFIEKDADKKEEKGDVVEESPVEEVTATEETDDKKAEEKKKADEISESELDKTLEELVAD